MTALTAIKKIRHYARNVLYVDTGVAHASQLEKALRKAIEDTGLQCEFRVNLVTSRGQYCGHAYVHISNLLVFYMLIGRNPDGTERVEKYPDPSWKAPTDKTYEEAFEEAEVEMKERIGKKLDWADYSDIEDCVRSRYEHPLLVRKLKPLVELPGYDYDEGQIARIKELAVAKGEDPSKIPKQGFFQISQAYVHELNENQCSNVLITRVPHWVSETILKDIFSPYASDSKTKITRKMAGKKISDTYPFITMLEKEQNKIVFITFDPETIDGQCAYLMTRKLIVSDREGRTASLIVDHSYQNTNFELTSPPSSPSPDHNKRVPIFVN